MWVLPRSDPQIQLLSAVLLPPAPPLRRLGAGPCLPHAPPSSPGCLALSSYPWGSWQGPSIGDVVMSLAVPTERSGWACSQLTRPPPAGDKALAG